MQHVAFLGLGVMGRGMAANLIDAGYDLTVWNRTKEKADALVELGASLASTPAEAAGGADAVLYCLANGEALEAVVFGADGVLEGAAEGQLAIDLSTVHPEASRREAEAYAERGVDFVAAPVFGSKNESAEGGLWIVAGGPEQAFEQARPLLDPLGASLHHMGADAGAGTSMKLAGNLLVASMVEALGESLLLAKKAGLDLRQVLRVIGEVDFRSPLFAGMGQSMTERDWSVSFELRHMLKDAHLIDQLAEELQVPLHAGSAARETLKAAVNQGFGEENASALVKALEGEAGVALDEATEGGGGEA